MKKKKRVVIYCRAELQDVDGNTLEKQSADVSKILCKLHIGWRTEQN